MGIVSMWSQLCSHVPVPELVGGAASAGAMLATKYGYCYPASGLAAGVTATAVAATGSWIRSSGSSATQRRLYRWMYGDALTGPVSEYNPLRWSSCKPAPAIITELQLLTPPNDDRE